MTMLSDAKRGQQAEGLQTTTGGGAVGGSYLLGNGKYVRLGAVDKKAKCTIVIINNSR